MAVTGTNVPGSESGDDRAVVIRCARVERTSLVLRRLIAATMLSSSLLVACSAPDDESSPGIGHTTRPTSNTTVPGSTSDAFSERLDEFFADLLRDTNSPGGIVAIQRGESDPIIVTGGRTTDDPPIDVTTETHWHVASITKSFIGALAIIMESDGSIDLDSPIATYLDSDFADLTLRQLLTHTSGLPEFGDDLEDPDAIDPLLLPFDHAYSLDEALQKAEELAPAIDPSRGSHYSNVNYLVAGAVLERVGGAPLGSLLRDRVLTPLQLDETRYLPDEHRGPKPAGGLDDLGGGTEIPSGALARTSLVTLIGPAAGAVSDVEDMLRWADVVFRQGRIGNVDLAPMLAVQPGGYGLGVAGVGASGTCIFDGCPPDESFERFSLAGDFPGASTRIWYDPRTDTILLVYLNRNALALDDAMATFLDV
jgi:D-alanyl-D-alanine carboxypeptidase